MHKKEMKVVLFLPLLIDLTVRLLNISHVLLGRTIRLEIKKTFSDNPQ